MKKPVKEIEVKARIRDKKKLLSNLKKLGIKLSGVIEQSDVVYLEPNLRFEDIKPGTTALRIRKEKRRTLLTFKRRQDVEMSSLEYETEISNPKHTQAMIEALGFYEVVRINKKRRKTKYKNYEICVDEVESLGNFIEVEKITNEDSFAVQEELFKFLETLGISRKDREKRGYDTLIYYKKSGKLG